MEDKDILEELLDCERWWKSDIRKLEKKLSKSKYELAKTQGLIEILKYRIYKAEN